MTTTGTTTLDHGTTLTATTPGYDARRNGQLIGRVHVRRDFSGRRWLADIFAYDGFEWILDRRTQPADLETTRAAVLAYWQQIDRRAAVISIR